MSSRRAQNFRKCNNSSNMCSSNRDGNNSGAINNNGNNDGGLR